MLEIDQARTGYGSLEVLHGVSLSVAEGEIVTVLGPNGTGKTTLMRLLSGVLPLWSGKVTFDGTDLGGLFANLADFGLVARREEEHLVDLAARVEPAPVVRVPFLRSDVHDVAGLEELAAHMVPD